MLRVTVKSAVNDPVGAWKIAVRELCSGRTSEAEFALVKDHVLVGYDILRTIEFPWPVAEIVLQHHERLDGSGYPSGIKGGVIMLEAKILGVADVVESMLAHRPYRPARGADMAISEIKKNKKKLYDAKVVNACLKVLKDKNFHL
jgi:HD-GYP domain-containing protein (c-di-GMP phosphodiesterase class II)